MNLPENCDEKFISGVSKPIHFVCLFTSVAFCDLLNDLTNQCIFTGCRYKVKQQMVLTEMVLTKMDGLVTRLTFVVRLLCSSDIFPLFARRS